jgi:hypothetical protein
LFVMLADFGGWHIAANQQSLFVPGSIKE